MRVSWRAVARMLPGAVVLAALLAFFLLDAGRYLQLPALQQLHGQLAQFYARQPLLVLVLFTLAYVGLFSLGLPVNSVMALLGGALFGFALGSVVVALASSLGALAAFLVARTLAGSWLRRRYAVALAAIDRGLARDGHFYLFSMRMIPLFPPALLSMLFGLSAMRAFSFTWVSALGMLASTLVYVNAGTRLAGLQSLREVLSPPVLASLALVGILPLLARVLLRRGRDA